MGRRKRYPNRATTLKVSEQGFGWGDRSCFSPTMGVMKIEGLGNRFIDNEDEGVEIST